jgi:hypothetical protein
MAKVGFGWRQSFEWLPSQSGWRPVALQPQKKTSLLALAS